MPIRWIAPEVLKDLKYTPRSDVYSVRHCCAAIAQLAGKLAPAA